MNYTLYVTPKLNSEKRIYLLTQKKKKRKIKNASGCVVSHSKPETRNQKVTPRLGWAARNGDYV